MKRYVPNGHMVDGVYRGELPDGRWGYFDNEQDYLETFNYEVLILEREQLARYEILGYKE